MAEEVETSRYPLIYAVVFGEAVVNDAVAILLASSVLETGSPTARVLHRVWKIRGRNTGLLAR